MKQLLKLCSVLAVAGSLFAGCAEPPSAVEGPEFQMGNGKGGGGSTTSPEPVWVFSSHGFVKGKNMPSISVSDIDGTDRTPIYLSTVSTNRPLFSTWSPDGGSVSFVDMPAILSNGWYGGTQWGTYKLLAVDVAVTGGKVVPSNQRTLISYSAADEKKIVGQTWSPATSGSGADLIAYIVYTPSDSRIYMISTNGGTPTLIYSIAHADGRVQGNSLTWKSDGSRLAFAQYTGINVTPATTTIKIIDLAGTIETTIDDGFEVISELQWSNSGLDKFTFEGVRTGSTTHSKYLIEAAAGSTASTLVANDGGGYGMYWSPDNSEACYVSSNGNGYRYNFATGVSTLTGAFPNGDWR